MDGLQNRVVLVTGAARRVGAAIARRLHQSGASVLLHYRSAHADAAALAQELNSARANSAQIVVADLLDSTAPVRLVEEALRAFGRLDALVNNASSFFPTPIETITEAHWLDLIGTNLKAPLFLAQAMATELSSNRGCIVNITDIHAERPLAGYLVYSVAKAGLLGLTRALARELAPAVRVNAVAPGPICWPEDSSFDALQSGILATTLLGRVGCPDDIAGAVHYLVAEAPFVTGQVLAVDGGRSVHL
jgi:pteridine reductase